jgi:hypothetical protein
VEEDALVTFADAEHVADVVTRHSLDVSQHHHLTLPGRKSVERGADAGQPALSHEPFIDDRLPGFGWERPSARRVEARRVHRRLGIVDRYGA